MASSMREAVSEALFFLSTAALGYAVVRGVRLVAALRARAALPRRERVYRSRHFDSSVWDEFEPRADDVFIVTSYKAGSTWVQQILSTLILASEEPLETISETSPWLDASATAAEKQALMAKLHAQAHRRFIKSHLPADAIPFYPQAKYIYVGRDGRDIFISMCHHFERATDAWYDHVDAQMNTAMNTEGPGGSRHGEEHGRMPRWVPGETSPASLFSEWLTKGAEAHPWETDGWPFWSVFTSVASWWRWRRLPNLLLVHHAALVDDLPGQMRRIAAFLQIPIDEDRFPDQVRRCTYAYMKAHAKRLAGAPPLGPWPHVGDEPATAEVFINQGVNGRWKEVLSPEQVRQYEAVAREKLGEECARWLATGELPADLN